MKYITLLYFTLFVSTLTFAQNFSWIKPLKPSAAGFFSYSKDVAVDAQGNVYIVGTYAGTIDFDPGPAVFNKTSTGPKDHSDDIFILKLNAAGDFQWVNTFGGSDFDIAEAVHITHDGYILVSGYFHSTVDFDPGPGTVNLNSSGERKTFIARYNTNGSLVWAKAFLGSGQAYGDGSDVTSDEAGNVYVTGGYSGTIDFDPGTAVSNLTGSFKGFLVKLDAAGQFKWVKKKGVGGTDAGKAITYHGGYIYVGLMASGMAEVAKFDTTGTELWSRKTQFSLTNSYVYIHGITADPSGNVIVTGRVHYGADFDPGPGNDIITTVGGSYDWDAFAWKLDTNGNHKWARQVGGVGADYGYSVAADEYGTVYISGTYSNSIALNIGGIPLNLPRVGAINSYLVQLGAAGQLQKAERFSGVPSPSGGVSVYGIAINKYRDLYLVGDYNNKVDFDPGPGTYVQTSAMGNYSDLFICKLAKGNLITGKVFVDANADDTYQAGEQMAPYIVVRAANATDTSYGLSNNQGDYLIGTGSGNYTLSIPDPKVYTTAANTQSVSFSSALGAVSSGHNMPVAYLPGIKDLYVTLTSLTIPRANRYYLVDVTYENRGTEMVNGSVSFQHSPLLNYIGASGTVTANGNEIQFSYTNLPPGETRHQLLTFQVSIVPAGTLISDTAMISPLTNDVTPYNNHFILVDTVRASFDPNDKRVLPSGPITPGMVASDTAYLDYTIRFQNTGNDTAFNVMLIDTLSTNLNIASLEMISASHPYTADIENRVLRFRFSDILLPDSTINEPLSHGYVRYRIRPLKTLALGTEIRNRAAIYFDYNDPVMTNQTLTLVAQPVLPVTLVGFTVENYNCRQVIVKWTTFAETGNAYFDLQRKIGRHQWQTIATKTGAGTSAIPVDYSYIDHPLQQQTIYYRLKQIDQDGRATYSPEQAIQCRTESGISVFPNPATDILHIQASSQFRYVLMDLQGKMLMQNSVTGTAVTISLGKYAAGIYLLNVYNEAGVFVHKILKK